MQPIVAYDKYGDIFIINTMQHSAPPRELRYGCG